MLHIPTHHIRLPVQQQVLEGNFSIACSIIVAIWGKQRACEHANLFWLHEKDISDIFYARETDTVAPLQERTCL